MYTYSVAETAMMLWESYIEHRCVGTVAETFPHLVAYHEKHGTGQARAFVLQLAEIVESAYTILEEQDAIDGLMMVYDWEFCPWALRALDQHAISMDCISWGAEELAKHFIETGM